MNEGYKKWEELKSGLSNRGLGINVKCLYERVGVLMTLYQAVAWGMRNAERMKVNALELNCFRVVGVTQMDRARTVRCKAELE